VDEKIKHQGWYCLGTTKLLAYVGMVGQWSNKSMSNNTIYHRWKNEHDDKGKKWPKGMFQNDDLAIDGDKAKIHTCTISSAITNKEMESRNPPLLNRNKSQYRLISMIEDALIFLPAQEHRIDEGSLYERNRGSLYQRNKNLDFINSNKGGKPIVIKEKKAMINNQSFNTFPKDQWYLSGDFNIKCKGKIPSQLSSFFSNGVHVNTFMNKLSKDKIR
jgi:hypothetical protein